MGVLTSWTFRAWCTVLAADAIFITGMFLFQYGNNKNPRFLVMSPTRPGLTSDMLKPWENRSQLQPVGRIISVFPFNRYTDMCKTWTGRPQEAKEWWHWACLINRYLATLDYTCKEPVKAGNWWMCDDPPWKPPQPCLVYSFGIGKNWKFDDFMYQKMNCTVHSFDPSLRSSHFMRDPKNLFYNIGLGGTDTKNIKAREDQYVRNQQTWQMLTLKSIMVYLGHQNSVLDYLKMDIELSEWPVLEYLLKNPDLLSKIRQLAVEWHIFPEEPKEKNFEKMYWNLIKLRDLGFYAFRAAPTLQWNNMVRFEFNSQSEMCYINSRFAG